MLFFLKDFIIGLAIFLAPTTFFMKPHNLKQLIAFDYYIIFASLIFFLLILIFFSILLRFAILKILNKQPQYIFLITCFGFFLLYFYAPLQKLVADLFFHHHKGSSYAVLICLFLFWFATLIAFINSQKFNLFFRRGIIIYASINFLIFFISYISYANIIDNKKSYNSQQNTQDLISFQEYDLLTPKNTLNKKNIYYIIVDGMIAIELAAQVEIINENKTKKALEESGLTYISNSFSSYSNTTHTIASIMSLDYPVTEESVKVTYDNTFPRMMYRSQKKIPLPELINKAGSEFYWIGNTHQICIEFINKPWTCTFSKKIRNLMRINSVLNSYYYNTPLKLIYYNTRLKDIINDNLGIGQRSIKYYMKYLQENNITDKNKFVFIHQLSPHYPYNVNKNCKPQKYNEKYEAEVENAIHLNNQKKYDEGSAVTVSIAAAKATFEGYKASYQCVLKEILEFTSFIAIEDPEAIIVFQADHGTSIHNLSTKEIKTPNDNLWFRANIFNAVKAPKNCFKKYRKPHSTINTVRFALNCAYGFDLPYLQQVHFQVFDSEDQLYMGKVIANKF